MDFNPYLTGYTFERSCLNHPNTLLSVVALSTEHEFERSVWVAEFKPEACIQMTSDLYAVYVIGFSFLFYTTSLNFGVML
jgi:hypothetical protein